MTRARALALIAVSLWLLGLQALPLAAFDYQRTKPNLIASNSTITSNAGWIGSGANYNSTVTHTAGSGSIAIMQDQLAFGPSFPVTVGKTYTCGAYITGTNNPTDFIIFGINLYDSGGTFISTAPNPSVWGYGAPNVWQEVVAFHQVAAGTASMRINVSRASNIVVNPALPVHIDDVYCGEDVSFVEPPGVKNPFDGGLVKVAANGTVSLKRSDGSFKPEMLRCMFVINLEPYELYAPNGWNCNMWAPNLANVKHSVDAGLPYAFMQLAQYVLPTNPLFGNIAHLESTLIEIYNSPYATNLVGYYMDNENSDFNMQVTVLNRVIQLDTVAGKRQRPIYLLQGGGGATIPFQPYINMTGSYEILGGAPPDKWLFILSHISNQHAPVVFGQIQETGVPTSPGAPKTAATMRAQVLATLDAGGSAIGYWHSDIISPELWYSSMPAIIDEALGVWATPLQVCGP